MKIGVVAESFRLDLAGSLAAAAKLNISGVQVSGMMGQLNAQTLTDNSIALARRMLADSGITLSALCGDMGSAMFYNPKQNADLLQKQKQILYAAKQLGTNIVTTHIGVVPNDSNSDRYKNMQDSCGQLAEYAKSLGGWFAVETGPENAVTLKAFLDSLRCKGIAVNLDPANLVMCVGDNPASAVRILQNYIVHTHAKDGIMLQKTDPCNIYDSRHDGTKAIVYDQYFKEVPLGQGGVNFTEYLAALKQIGYNGFLTIEREVGANPAEDIALAVQFLTQNLKNL